MYGFMDKNHQSSPGNLEGLIDGLLDEIDRTPKDERFWIACGTLHLLKNDFEHALDCFQIAHNLDPHNVYIHYRLGATYYRLNDFVAAKEWLTNYIDLARHIELDWMAFYFLALSEKYLGELDQAKQILEEGLKIFPLNNLLLLTVAEIEFERKEYGNAAEIFERLLGIETREEYWYFLFKCYFELGYKDLAAHSFRQFMHIDPNFQLDENWASLFGLTIFAEDLKELKRNIAELEADLMVNFDISQLENLKSLYQGDTTGSYLDKISMILNSLRGSED